MLNNSLTWKDDTWIHLEFYVTFELKKSSSMSGQVKSFSGSRIWIFRNRFKMNDIKTEIIFAPYSGCSYIASVVSFFQLKRVQTPQSVLWPQAVGKLMHAYVTPSLYYCTSIPITIPEVSI